MRAKKTDNPVNYRSFALLALIAVFTAGAVASQVNPNEPGVLEPVTSFLQGRDIRVPNTDQTVNGIDLALAEGTLLETATSTTSMLGFPITQVSSPNEDMRLALLAMASAAAADNAPGMRQQARELERILLGKTRGRIYDGFSMLNFNRWGHPGIGASHFPPGAVAGEYKMKVAAETGETFISPYDGEERKVWDVDINMLYYDGQIDSDTFLVRFPFGHHGDDTLHINYRVYSLVSEDFSPTSVVLDRRESPSTTNFPFKGLDAVWIPFGAGQVLNVTVKNPPLRQVRGVYTWGWRVHPPRIQFMQPIYEIQNQNTMAIELDPQSESFAYRNREELTLDAIADAAPEKKMWDVVQEVFSGASTDLIESWLADPNVGPLGTWIEWADLATVQTQLPTEAWDILLSEDGLPRGDHGDYNMISVYMNNEMYGEGPFLNEVEDWTQTATFDVKLINLDNHTHYFRNVDFGSRIHDDILRCCGGGETSFEVFNFKPSYGAPKVAEMQWRAGWGFRPHYNIIQQQDVFPRGLDRGHIAPFTGGFGDVFYGYQYSEAKRGGDFRFNPPGFIITDTDDPAPFPLRDSDGLDGITIGQSTEGYGELQMCPDDPSGDFCLTDFGPTNPHGVLNWPSPADPGVPKTELRFPPFLRNPAQGVVGSGDIIPPTAAWRPFLWISPYNGTLFIDDTDESKGFWADLTYSHGRPVFANSTLSASVEAPRSAGQVFYQFDDLFHDNSIFSPHPVQTGINGDAVDSLTVTSALVNGGDLRVKGTVDVFNEIGGRAGWVSLYEGAPDANGCVGAIIAVAEVRNNGRFRADDVGTSVTAGNTICVETTVGGFDSLVVQ